MVKRDLDKLKQDYKDLFRNPTAKHLVNHLYKVHDSLVREAQRSNDPNESFGLLKQASGIIKVLDHIKTHTETEIGRE